MKIKRIINLIVVGVISINLVGCTNKNNSYSTNENISEKEILKPADALEQLNVLLKQEDIGGIWQFAGDTKIDSVDYYSFEDVEGADFRYLISPLSGEIYYESVLDMGNLIPIKEANNQEELNEIEVLKLVQDIKPKLNKMEGIEEVKEAISKYFALMLKESNFSISDFSKNNDFIISDTTYNKYTKDYKQLMYYIFTEDFTKGNIVLNMHLSKEIHSEYKFSKDDDFIKLMHKIYGYVTGDKINLDEFTNIIKSAYEGSGELYVLSDKYEGLEIKNEATGETATKKLTFDLNVNIEDTLKSKYYKKEYETVSTYYDDSKKVKNEIAQINKEPSNKYTDIRYSNDWEVTITTFSAEYNYGKSKFMQTGNMLVAPKSKDGVYTNEDLQKGLDVLKLVMGGTLYEKINKDSLTLEKIDNFINSSRLRDKYSEIIIETPKNQLYLDNACITPIVYDEDDASKKGIWIDYSIPVIAEGIREI